MCALLNFLKAYASNFDFLKWYASKASKSSSLCLQILSVWGTLYCNFMGLVYCKVMVIITTNVFHLPQKPIACPPPSTEIHCCLPVLLSVLGSPATCVKALQYPNHDDTPTGFIRASESLWCFLSALDSRKLRKIQFYCQTWGLPMRLRGYITVWAICDYCPSASDSLLCDIKSGWTLYIWLAWLPWEANSNIQ